MKKILQLKWRILFIVLVLALLLGVIASIAWGGQEAVIDGRANLNNQGKVTGQTQVVNGQWEFYWDQLLSPQDFVMNPNRPMDAYMKVPDSWASKRADSKTFSGKGVATYRVFLNYSPEIEDPAIRIQNIACAYKVFVEGQLVAENGLVSKDQKEFKEGTQIVLIDLPPKHKNVELVMQVANLNYAKGGIRQSPLFASKEVLQGQHNVLLALQLAFAGAVIIFGIYYLLLFVLQTQNKSALLFSILCLITGIRSVIWGEVPIQLLFPAISYTSLAYINYITGFNLLPAMVLFITRLYPLSYNKKLLVLVLFPSLLFNLLLATSAEYMSNFTPYLYILILIQMVYLLGIMIKAVLNKIDTSPMMYLAVCFYVLAINLDILHFSGLGGFYNNNMFLSGNIAVIIAMSFVQAKQQSEAHKKLVLYNQNLLEADRLKDTIMATELSFLHAQIKPHFLYNALDAIANICETNGQKAAKLIIDLAIYLRGSLEFNRLDKTTTIEKELELVDTYFNIEQARFGQKIQLIKDIHGPMHMLLPVLVLQPLVENAVRHGISKRPEGGSVTITITITNPNPTFTPPPHDQGRGELYVSVQDTGIGMSKDKLEGLLSRDKADQGVGLVNIDHRLQKMYGKGLHISAQEGVGTLVKFTIPY